jgi:ectoine hydroxylase-related dioxygenase (phytanoyl-CoA dioxygenase family)
MRTFRFGPPPTSALDVEPTDDQVAFFKENGFLAVDRLTTDEEIDWLVPIFDAAFEEVDAGEVEPGGSPKVAYQSMVPELRFPELLDTTFSRNARRYAARLLEVDESQLSGWGHMIRKPVGNSRLAPWHQDEAYWEPELRYPAALGAWLPLHAVTVAMGCMQFIPGSHKRGVLDHVFYDGDPLHNLLEAVDVDTSKAVACPLPKGGATFHHKRTLHFTEPNTTDEMRRAYPIEFQLAPEVRDEPRQWSWVDAHRAAAGRGPIPVVIADGKVIRNGL